jgi:hypothetical protein
MGFLSRSATLETTRMTTIRYARKYRREGNARPISHIYDGWMNQVNAPFPNCLFERCVLYYNAAGKRGDRVWPLKCRLRAHHVPEEY